MNSSKIDNTNNKTELTFEERVQIGYDIVLKKYADIEPYLIYIIFSVADRVAGESDGTPVDNINKLTRITLTFTRKDLPFWIGGTPVGGSEDQINTVYIEEIAPGEYGIPTTSETPRTIYKKIEWPIPLTLQKAFDLKIEAGFSAPFSAVELWQFNSSDKIIMRNKRLAMCFRFGGGIVGKNILVNVLTKEVYRRF